MKKIKAYTLKIKKKIVTLGMLFVIAVMMFLTDNSLVNAQEKALRVGYDLNSNFIQEDNGEYYGYGVEYLEKIAEYTDWDYTYVKDASWQDSLEKLRNGEIDFICTAHYTEERAEEFLYSDIPLGYETTLLYTYVGSEISYQDYEAMNGCRVGLLKESYSAAEFLDYMEEHELACDTIYFEQEDEMMAALKERELDILVIGSRYGTSKLQIVDRLGANAFYCITNKQNEALIEEIENVLQQIMFDDPTFEGELNAEFFGSKALSNMPLYTKEEMVFIEKQDTIKVKIMINQKPSCYEEDGEVKGIWVEYLNLLSEKCGIQFDVEAGIIDENTESYYDELIEQDYLLFRSQRAREYNNRIGEHLTTNPLAEIKISYLIRKEEFVQNRSIEKRVALTKDLSYLENLLLKENDAYQFVYYEHAEECLEALVNKDVDMAVQNSYWVSYLMQKPKFADLLTEISGTNYRNSVVLVADEDEEMLINILNKAINYISQEEREDIVSKELLIHPYPLEWEDVWYQYWEWIVFIAIVLFITLILYTLTIRRTAALKVKQKENELLEKKLQLDELTGLYNRTYFYEKAREFIDNTQEEMCIIMMNILNFKVINEIYGVQTGDRILKEIGEQLQERISGSFSITARFMADYYFTCLPKSKFEMMKLPDRLKTSLEEVDIKVVYGVFFVEGQREVPIHIMCDRANIAAHDKRHSYKDYIHFYDDTQRKQQMLEQEIENNMEKAIENREFVAYIQPKYHIKTHKIVGGEALVRWIHPVKGMISPGLFINVFEKNGFIIQLDYYIWEETCRMLAEFQKCGLPRIPISINVSKAHFYGKDLRNKLKELIEKYDLLPDDIELEITESIYMDDPRSIIKKMEELREDGFKIAMDDFGSGYSSLNMLKEIPLDIMKMDLKFLDGGVENQAKGHCILKFLIEMAYAMDLKVVVEGIETDTQVEFLSQFKDCLAQGYYFSRPVNIDTYKKMLEQE